MAEPWFRMHANIADKAVAWRLSKATGVPFPAAVGHLAMFWGKVSQHGTAGDVSAVEDALLEKWAGWEKKRGAFARWVRDEHTTEGVVNEYDDFNGHLEERREKDRKRKAEFRKKSTGQSAGRRADVQGLRYETIRDDTKRVVEAGEAPPPATAIKGDLRDRFPEGPLRDAYLAYRRSHRMPDGFDATLNSVHEGMGAKERFDWSVIGAALIDMRGGEKAFGAQLLRGYCRKVLEKPPVPVPRGLMGQRASKQAIGRAALDIGEQNMIERMGGFDGEHTGSEIPSGLLPRMVPNAGLEPPHA